MNKYTDQVKGRVEEAVGSLTGNKDLKRRGRTDRLAGEAKAKLDKANDKVEQAIDNAKDAVQPK
jgi:uncharacterized protein YjbJ (UPF0337 family)